MDEGRSFCLFLLPTGRFHTIKKNAPRFGGIADAGRDSPGRTTPDCRGAACIKF
jgi:hypothetical protein